MGFFRKFRRVRALGDIMTKAYVDVVNENNDLKKDFRLLMDAVEEFGLRPYYDFDKDKYYLIASDTPNTEDNLPFLSVCVEEEMEKADV